METRQRVVTCPPTTPWVIVGGETTNNRAKLKGTDHKLQTDRRDVLKIAACLLAGLPSVRDLRASGTDEIPEPLGSYISSARGADGLDSAVLLDQQSRIIRQIRLPARGHGAASHQLLGKGCLFARRPGMFMQTFDLRGSAGDSVIEPASGRHFYGHGTYSEAGDYLYATENIYDTAQGVLGIYAVDDSYRRVGEIVTDGIGPHEVIRVPGSRLLVVANGGIRTHPDQGRDKLNIDSMQPSIVIIDSSNGAIVGRHQLTEELHQLSLRHLACDNDGQIWFAGQYEGDDASIAAISGSLSIEQTMHSFYRGASSKGLQILSLPENLQARTQHYLSSLAVAGQQVIFTSARGGIVFSVDARTRQLTQRVSILDGSGVAACNPTATPDQHRTIVDPLAQHSRYLVSSGTGSITRLSDNHVVESTVHKLQWDNHLYRL